MTIAKTAVATGLMLIAAPSWAYYLTSWVGPGFSPQSAQPVTHWSASHVTRVESWIFTHVELNATYTNDDGNIIIGPNAFRFPVTGPTSYTSNFVNPPRSDRWDALFQLILFVGSAPTATVTSENDFRFMYPPYGR